MNLLTLPKLLSLSLTLALLPHTEAKTPGSSGSPDPFIAVWKGHYYLTYTTRTDIRIRTAKSLADLNSAPEQNVWADFEPSRSSNVCRCQEERTVGFGLQAASSNTG